jgi:hypothetical protein
VLLHLEISKSSRVPVKISTLDVLALSTSSTFSRVKQTFPKLPLTLSLHNDHSRSFSLPRNNETLLQLQRRSPNKTMQYTNAHVPKLQWKRGMDDYNIFSIPSSHSATTQSEILSHLKLQNSLLKYTCSIS